MGHQWERARPSHWLSQPSSLRAVVGAVAMLACARLGALHTVVFGGFSAEALGQRCADCRCAQNPDPVP